jgi:uncharacterized Tic20 family protein
MNATNDKNSATLLHLSSLSRYFVPFGNFIFPIIIWSSLKEKAPYVDQQGKECINFQLSLFMYSMILALIAVPILFTSVLHGISFSAMAYNRDFIFEHFNLENITGILAIAAIAVLLFLFMKIAEFFLIIYAAVKTSDGEAFRYPATIRFIK